MSDLVIVPSWIIDGLADAAERDPVARDTLLRYQRWTAHTTMNPALLGNIVATVENVRGQLEMAARILRGEDLLQAGKTGLDSVAAGEYGRRADAELERERAAHRDSRPVRD